MIIRKEEKEKFIIILDIEGTLSSGEVHAIKRDWGGSHFCPLNPVS